jgi:glycosyltransferase involved in cell wall biosynthesis
MPLFSVIIPAYNRADLIGRSIESALAQSLTDFEIIVVDDGSTDSTLEALRPFERRITILKQNNQGPGAARNHGIKHATGRYVAFLDSDDVWFPWTLEVFAQVIQDYHSPSLIAACLREFTDQIELSGVKRDPTRVEYFGDYLATSGRGIFVGAGMSVILRQSLLDAGGFTDRAINSEDHDLVMRLDIARGFAVIRAPVTLGYFRHTGSVRLNIDKAVAGIQFLIDQEKAGRYPGGPEKRRARLGILASHVRPSILDFIRAGHIGEAMRLYRETFGWHVNLGRWRFLIGAPIRALAKTIRR